MCSVYKSATFAIIFSPIRLNLNSIILQDMKLDTFAQKLRYLRLERNLNQHEFANLLNRSFTSVCYWEQGNRIPKTETIKEIAEVLNVDYTYFKRPQSLTILIRASSPGAVLGTKTASPSAEWATPLPSLERRSMRRVRS